MEGAWVVRNPDALPPPDARLIKYGETIATPTDDRGLIDIPQLIQDVKATVDPTFNWSGQLGVHHFYWPGNQYLHLAEAHQANPHRFRELPIHKGLVPKVFENWLHLITEVPEMPAGDVMLYRTEAWEVASNLFRMARKTIRWERQARRRRELIAANPSILKLEFDGSDIIGEEVMQEVFDKNFRGLAKQKARLHKIPEEFRLLNVEETPEKLAASLGRFVLHGSANLVNAIAS